MKRYDQTAPDVIYFNPKTDGERLIKSKHTLVTWDGVEQFKAFYADDFRFFDQFTIPCVSADQAQLIAEEYAAEFDLACDEDTDDD